MNKSAPTTPARASSASQKKLTAADAIALQASLSESRLQAKIDRLTREQKQLGKQLDEAALRFAALVELDGARRPITPWEPRKGRTLGRDKRIAAAFACLSDIHPEEDVDARKVNNLNHYNPAIASHRLQRHREGIEWLIREQQSMFTVRDLYLWLGGDLITGYIHDELAESNHLSPTEASMMMLREISDTIRFVRRVLPDVRIHAKCNRGNHGRTTAKIRVNTGAENSYEWMMYCLLAREFESDPMVEFEVERGELLYTEIYGLTVRTTHGDATKFNGGVHGLSIPIGKAVMKWNQTKKAHLTVMGHYHTYFPGRELVINGSGIGYNPYGIHIGAPYEDAVQAFFLIDRERGKTQDAPIWVQHKEAEAKIKDVLPSWWVKEFGTPARSA